MKSKLRILAITLIMVLGCGLVSVNADEVTHYDIYINGTELTSETPSVTAGNGTVSYNPDTNELTLDNATITATITKDKASTEGVISMIDPDETNVTIKLVGINTIVSTVREIDGIYSANPNLTITGDGSLTITTDDYGVYVSTSLTVKDTTLNVTSTNGPEGLHAYDSLVIDNSAVDLRATGAGGVAAYSDSSVRIQNLTGKVLQASNSPITVKTDIISDPSTFDVTRGYYHYVKISNLYNVTAEWDVNSTVALETAGPSSGDAGKILAIDGDTVTATIGTADGYKIKSVLVNGKESKDSVKDGKLTFTVNGDTSIKVVSEAVEKSPNTGDEAGLYTIIAMLALLGATATVKLSGKNN